MMRSRSNWIHMRGATIMQGFSLSCDMSGQLTWLKVQHSTFEISNFADYGASMATQSSTR